MTPEIALYGSLYGSNAMRTLFSVPERLRALAHVEAALARAQAQTGLIPQSAADAIAAAAADVDTFDVAALVADTERVGYPVVGLVAALGQRAGADAARYLHRGATTQDILDTARMLQLRTALGLLQDDLRATIDALAMLAHRHRDDVMAGRTHLQHALPITFGYKVAVWLAPLLESIEAYDALRERVFASQLGGAVGTSAALGPHARAVAVGFADALGLAVPDTPWHADRSRFAALAAEIAITCGALAKIAGDVILLMQTEVGEVFEPHAPGRGGSSTMPQKRNPIASEYVIACTRGVHALLPLLMGALQGDHERSTGPWQSEEIALPQIMILASGAFAQSRAIAQGITVDTARMRANLALTHGLIAAETVTMALAASLGKADAHYVVEGACAVAIERELPLYDILVADSRVTAHLSSTELQRLLTPAASLGEAGAVVDRVLARCASLARPH